MLSEWRGMDKETPAYAVLTTFLNLLKSGCRYCRFRLSASRGRGNAADMHTADKERPRFQGVGSKNEC